MTSLLRVTLKSPILTFLREYSDVTSLSKSDKCAILKSNSTLNKSNTKVVGLEDVGAVTSLTTSSVDRTSW